MTDLAEHDFLTGLPNQRVLRDRIEQAIKFATRNHKKLAVLFLDLDGFKHITTLWGISQATGFFNQPPDDWKKLYGTRKHSAGLAGTSSSYCSQK